MPELPCRHSSWLPVRSNGVPSRLELLLRYTAITCGEGRERPRQSGSASRSRNRQKLSARRKSNEIDPDPGGGRLLLPGRRLLPGTPRRPPGAESGRGARAPDPRHDPGRGPPNARGSRPGDRGGTRSRSSDAPPDGPSAAPDDEAAVFLTSLPGTVPGAANAAGASRTDVATSTGGSNEMQRTRSRRCRAPRALRPVRRRDRAPLRCR